MKNCASRAAAVYPKCLGYTGRWLTSCVDRKRELLESSPDLLSDSPTLARDVELRGVRNRLLPVPGLAEQLDVAARKRPTAINAVEGHPLVELREQILPRDVAVRARSVLTLAQNDGKQVIHANASGSVELVAILETILHRMACQRLLQPTDDVVDLMPRFTLASLTPWAATILRSMLRSGLRVELERPFDAALKTNLAGPAISVIPSMRGQFAPREWLGRHKGFRSVPSAVSVAVMPDAVQWAMA